MRLFQNIFEQEGLELYLYAYRVIATSPGVRTNSFVLWTFASIGRDCWLVWSDWMRTEFSITWRHWPKYSRGSIRILSSSLRQRRFHQIPNGIRNRTRFLLVLSRTRFRLGEISWWVWLRIPSLCSCCKSKIDIMETSCMFPVSKIIDRCFAFQDRWRRSYRSHRSVRVVYLLKDFTRCWSRFRIHVRIISWWEHGLWTWYQIDGRNDSNHGWFEFSGISLVQRTLYQRLFSFEVGEPQQTQRHPHSSFHFRPYRQHFLTLVALMLDTGLPCFRGRTLEQFNARFKPDANEADAARYMHEMINRCAHNIRTRLYDYIQFQQNSIPFWECASLSLSSCKGI